jgi:hypothetical protein
VYTRVILWREGLAVAGDRGRAHKHFRLDARKIKRAKRLLRVDTETEAIERALDLVISEHVRSRLAAEANDRFLASGIHIEDVYGTVEE